MKEWEDPIVNEVREGRLILMGYDLKGWENSIVNEVREARAKIMAEAGSLEDWFKLLKKEQLEHQGQDFQNNKVKMDNKL